MRTRMYLGVHVHLGMYTAVALLFHVSGSFRCALMGVPCHLRMLSIFSTLTTWWNWLIISPQAKRAKTDPHQGTPTRAHLQPPECASCITCTCACTCTWTSVGAQFVCVRVCVCVCIIRARGRSASVQILQHVTRTSILIPVSVKKHSSKEEYMWENQFPKHQIRGWRAVSAGGLQGKGCHKRNVVFVHRHQ